MDAFTEQRDAANFRSVTRSDPSVVEILQTSVHSTIYHYITPDGTDDGEWIKQKAEGPMFIVRRSTAPEYAIFMLNRATLKNVTIPLIKGEMRAKTVGRGMLQVQRRGEKVKRGAWFAEEPSVEDFAMEITRICGPPSQRPESTNPANRSETPQSATEGVSGDGFSRLFAGLLHSPAAGSSTPPSHPSQPSPAPAARLPSPPQAQQLHQPLPHHPSAPAVGSVEPFAAREAPVPHISPFPPPTSSAAAPPAPAPTSFATLQNVFTPPPGQTVDDLLNSILGVGSPMAAFRAPAPAPGPSAPPVLAYPSQQAPPVPPHPQPQQQAQRQPSLPPSSAAPPIPLETKPEAQRAVQLNQGISPTRDSGTGPSAPSAPPLSSPLNANDLLAGIQASAFPPLPQPQRPGAISPLNANDLLAGIQSSVFSPPQQLFSPSAPPLEPAPPAHSAIAPPLAAGPLVESVVDALGGVSDLRAGGRDGFARVLENLVRNEPRFVDDIWQGYLRRMGGG